jgi:hypothetical protein
MKQYHSSPTKFLTLYTVALVGMLIVNYHDLSGLLTAIAIAVSFLVALFLIQRQTYLCITDTGELIYRHFTFTRSPVRIADIVEIKSGPAFGGLGRALYVVYRFAGREKSLKIYSKNFADSTISEFLADMSKANPAMQVNATSGVSQTASRS